LARIEQSTLVGTFSTGAGVIQSLNPVLATGEGMEGYLVGFERRLRFGSIWFHLSKWLPRAIKT
jgi:hypothetical protein